MAGRAELCRASGVPGGCVLRVVRAWAWVRQVGVRCAWAGVGVPVVSGGAGWYGSPMRTLHIDQGIYYNRKKKEKHEKRAEPAKQPSSQASQDSQDTCAVKGGNGTPEDSPY